MIQREKIPIGCHHDVNRHRRVRAERTLLDAKCVLLLLNVSESVLF